MAEKLVKDCSVVIVKLLEEIAVRGTVKVYRLPPQEDSSDESCSDSETCKDFLPPVAAESLERLQKCVEKVDRSQRRTEQKLSVYTKVNEFDVITEVKCKRFRKRKLEPEEDFGDLETTVESVVSDLVERAACSVVTSTIHINCNSPGPKEEELVKEFCEENGFASEDYNDLKDLFTFRTLPLLEEPIYSQKRTGKRKVWKKLLRKTPVERPEDQQQIAMTPTLERSHCEVAQCDPPSTSFPSGLEKVQNEKIRKILEDFGRLSRSQESLDSNAQKKTLAKVKTPNTSRSRKCISAKPLNLCKKDKAVGEKKKTDKPPEKPEPTSSGSILKELLYPHSAEQKHVIAKDSETQTDQMGLIGHRSEKTYSAVAKKTTSQQTDEEGTDNSAVDNFNEETKTPTEPEIQIRPNNVKWINDPNALLAKIQKLKKDIVYLDLLAEEKEKERIAILCFKSYKESILKKIFANEVARKDTVTTVPSDCTTTTAPCNKGSSHPVIIPELIHTVKVPIPNGKAARLTLSTPLTTTMHTIYPPTVTFLQTLRPQSCVQNTNIKNLIGIEKQDGNCLDCELSNSSSLHLNCRNHCYPDSLSQDSLCLQNSSLDSPVSKPS